MIPHLIIILYLHPYSSFKQVILSTTIGSVDFLREVVPSFACQMIASVLIFLPFPVYFVRCCSISC